MLEHTYKSFLPSERSYRGQRVAEGDGLAQRGDQVAQALEAACLIPMLLAPRLVVAGDHCQLAPTITSQAAAAGGGALAACPLAVQPGDYFVAA